MYSPAARFSGKKKPDYNHDRGRCFECNEIGNIARNCSRRRREYKRQHSRESVSGQYSSANHATMLTDSSSEIRTPFILDSGASDHMISDVNALFNVHDIPPREIYLGNGSVVLSNSSGNLELLPTGKTETTGSVVLRDVLVVPSLKTNLISCSQLCRSGFKVQFDNETCQILEENGTKLTGALHNKVYRVDANICRSREGVAE